MGLSVVSHIIISQRSASSNDPQISPTTENTVSLFPKSKSTMNSRNQNQLPRQAGLRESPQMAAAVFGADGRESSPTGSVK